ncbi:TIGR01212 family radical SAM protein [Alkalilimnicola ehrlichii]|uniref:TIGR01212 family radical SAM protein n=1 Tax=Alkalilimnicola ehrlichii TaxID=351052 RepID=UPI0026961F6F|nr:TIGR01212 family radical SAM protein [Alkalilimnicola ehrlichii]
MAEQIAAGKAVIARRTGAQRYLAYFQAYTNTYDDAERLRQLYDDALSQPQVVGLSIGTRPDCLPDAVLALLADYQQQGYEIWLELGLQSAFDDSLRRVNRGHGFAEYQDAVRRTHAHNLQLCTHLIVGLPGETAAHNRESLQRVLDLGTHGLKLHPLHVVKNTLLAKQWKRGEYQALTCTDYIAIAGDLVRRTPQEVIFHRLTATASPELLLAPEWCARKWAVLNALSRNLARYGGQAAQLD